jgi:hypothetical protein
MNFSKPFMMLICVLALAFAASAAQIVVRDADEDDPVDEAPPSGSTAVISSQAFSFTSPSGTSPATPENPSGTPCLVNGEEIDDCSFLNASGVGWTNLRVTVTPVQTFDFCGIIGNFGKFTDCTAVSTGGPGPVIVDFYGGVGIPFGTPRSKFKLELIDWAPNTQFMVQANIPEPATLMVTGGSLLSLALFRRRSRPKRLA